MQDRGLAGRGWGRLDFCGLARRGSALAGQVWLRLAGRIHAPPRRPYRGKANTGFRSPRAGEATRRLCLCVAPEQWPAAEPLRRRYPHYHPRTLQFIGIRFTRGWRGRAAAGFAGRIPALRGVATVGVGFAPA